MAVSVRPPSGLVLVIPVRSELLLSSEQVHDPYFEFGSGVDDNEIWCGGTPHTGRARGLWPATPFRLNSKNIECAQTTLPCS